MLCTIGVRRWKVLVEGLYARVLHIPSEEADYNVSEDWVSV